YRLQRCALGGGQQTIGARIDGGFLAPHFTGCGKPVEEHLLDTQRRLTASQRGPVTVASGPGGRIIGAFAAIAGEDIDAGQVSTPCCLELVISRQATIDAGLHLWMRLQRLLYSLGQALGMRVMYDSRQGER